MTVVKINMKHTFDIAEYDGTSKIRGKVLRDVAEGRKKKTEEEVAQQGFRERDMEERVRVDVGGEVGQTAGGS